MRTVEDLLFLTRSLKEAWTLGQIRPRDESQENDSAEKEKKADEMMEKILEK